MSSFAPVYRPSTTQQSFLAREQKRERKRKRNALDDADEHDDLSDSERDESAPRVLHPVNKTDPYYVAGHPRDKPLPGGNFPHAAVKSSRDPQLPAEEELARLNPPIYVPKIAQTDHASSLRARHLDNLTAVLHNCMLKGDWERASRAWGLILRTEIAGRGVDIRQNGRWTVGAEILMRRDQVSERIHGRRLTASSNDELGEIAADTISVPVIKDESFKKARDYYDRLIVQHPHLQRTHHSIVSALSIYPARFSLWIYQVQDKSKRERRRIQASSDSAERDLNASPGSERSDRSDRIDQRRMLNEAKRQEHKDAMEIARQLDELLVSPPYDSSHEMLYIRGMVALWLCDLQMELLGLPHENFMSGTSDDGEGDTSLEQVTSTQPQTQRRRASKIFRKLLSAGMELPPSIHTFLDEEEEDEDE